MINGLACSKSTNPITLASHLRIMGFGLILAFELDQLKRYCIHRIKQATNRPKTNAQSQSLQAFPYWISTKYMTSGSQTRANQPVKHLALSICLTNYYLSGLSMALAMLPEYNGTNSSQKTTFILCSKKFVRDLHIWPTRTRRTNSMRKQDLNRQQDKKTAASNGTLTIFFEISIIYYICDQKLLVNQFIFRYKFQPQPLLPQHPPENPKVHRILRSCC